MSGNHADRSHAKLSASGSKRWLTCTPSVKLEQEFPDSTSVYAEEGTLAHEISEQYLLKHLEIISKAAFTRRINKHKKHELFSEGMLDYVESYVDQVIERMNYVKSLSDDVTVLLEQRLDFSNWVPDGFGTGDVLIVGEGILEVVDLKYGKGVPVSAEGNTQMRLYALGAINQFSILYDIETVNMTIVQPRLDSISTDTISVDELLTWADEVVKPRAEMAIDGEGEFVAGDHCQFCKARYTCRARAEYNLALAKLDFAKPPSLSNDEIGEVLGKADELKKWAEEVKAYALAQAEEHGVKFPGWKLVEGRSNRKYTDEKQVAKVLFDEGYNEEAIYKKSLLGISAMEKGLGKKRFAELLNGFVIKPAGRPTLVPKSDKRPEIGSTASAVEDFS
ncbi:DUF2800 domain-containing protein [Bacillaceae bacterium Marseille-Q3522]|nr:DUF2800 domain-containing protein [Bacillaceae bacterium Marseille-Q3522]